MDKELRHQLIWALYVPSALIAVAYALLTPVMPVYAGNLTSIYTLIGIILAAESIGRLFGDLPSSWFLRRFGMKQTILVALWLALIPIVLLFWISNVWLTIVMLFISGLGHAFYNIARHSYITIMISKEKRGRAIGLLGGVYRFGKFVGPLMGGWVGGTLGLNYAFLAFGIATLATIFFIWRFMSQADVSEKPQQGSQGLLIGKMLRDNRQVLLTAGSGQILAQLIREGWLVLIPLYAATILGLDVQAIGVILGVGSALDLVFFYLSGVIMDRFGRKWAIVPSFVAQSVGVVLMLFVNSAVALAVVSGMIGFANALSSGTMMTLGSDFAPSDTRGEFLSMWRLIGDLGSVSGPILVGMVAQALILQWSVLAVAGSGFAAALLFTVFVPETLKREAPVVAPVASAGD